MKKIAQRSGRRICGQSRRGEECPCRRKLLFQSTTTCRRPPESAASDIEGAKTFLEALFEDSPNRHCFADGFHLGRHGRIGLGKVFKCGSASFCHRINKLWPSDCGDDSKRRVKLAADRARAKRWPDRGRLAELRRVHSISAPWTSL